MPHHACLYSSSSPCAAVKQQRELSGDSGDCPVSVLQDVLLLENTLSPLPTHRFNHKPTLLNVTVVERGPYCEFLRPQTGYVTEFRRIVVADAVDAAPTCLREDPNLDSTKSMVTITVGEKRSTSSVTCNDTPTPLLCTTCTQYLQTVVYELVGSVISATRCHVKCVM
jgi:hypothetical protein